MKDKKETVFDGLTLDELLNITPQQLARVKLNALKSDILSKLKNIITIIEKEDFVNIPTQSIDKDYYGYETVLTLGEDINFEETYDLLIKLKSECGDLCN